MLDTNTVSALMKGAPPVAARIAEIARDDVAISQVTAAEIEFGLKYLTSSKRRSLLRFPRTLTRRGGEEGARGPPRRVRVRE